MSPKFHVIRYVGLTLEPMLSNLQIILYQGPKTGNSLPYDITSSTNIATFSDLSNNISLLSELSKTKLPHQISRTSNINDEEA